MSIPRFNPAHYQWAVSEALRAWNDQEGATHLWALQTSSQGEEDLQRLRSFLVTWKITRSIRTDGKPKILSAYASTWREKWVAGPVGSSDSYGLVEQFAQLAKSEGWSTPGVTPTSLASKFAFMSNPAVFAPYDRFGRVALKKFGHATPAHDYKGYMRGFIKVRDALADITKPDAKRIAEQARPPMSVDVAGMRIVDKLMMREGGFGTAKNGSENMD